MQESSENDQYLQQAFSNVSRGTHIQSFPAALMANTAFLNSHSIDELIQIEMKRIRDNWSCSEEQFVEQMLVENPITIERRTNNNNNHNQQQQEQQAPNSEDELINVETVTTDTKKEINLFLQQQRAEACRRSRYNNKIKKAKTKYRHKFMSQKLLQSVQLFDCIQDLIVKAENHLLAQGCTQHKLQYLRQSFDLDTAVDSIQNLEYTIKMEK